MIVLKYTRHKLKKKKNSLSYSK